MLLADLKMENPLGSPILPHLRRQISSRIGDYSSKTSSLYLRQARQSLSLGGNLRTRLEKLSTPIGSLDMLIAAHALSIGCSFVTRNENWVKCRSVYVSQVHTI